MERIISLASGVLPEFPPEQVVASAAAAGFNAVGIWYDADIWSEQLTRTLARALQEQHLIALDIEVVWFHPGEKIDCHDRIIDIAAEIGARNILCVSSEPDIKDTQRRFEHLCRRAEGTGIRIVLEFLSLTTIKTLDQALEVIRAVDHRAGGILIDALHLTRNGSIAADLDKLDPQLLPYLQLCDAKLQPDDSSTEGLIDDAIYQRCLPGEGELPLTDLLNAFDHQVPVSLEIRSRQLMDQFPDPNRRAKAVYEQAQQYFREFNHT